MKYNLKEIEEILSRITEENEFIEYLKQDERKGAQRLLKAWEKTRDSKRKLEEEWDQMMYYENMFRADGCIQIAGVDEVGRGPLAGPVTAAAVILPADLRLPGLNDSKKISVHKRKFYYDILNTQAAVGVGEASVAEIDELNIYQASKLAMMRAVEALPVVPDALLIDAMTLPADILQTSIIKGDAKSVSIAAASVVAKVQRDDYMKELHSIYPGYGFAENAGYGTKAHLSGLEKFGITKEHRRSFAPVKAYIT